MSLSSFLGRYYISQARTCQAQDQGRYLCEQRIGASAERQAYFINPQHISTGSFAVNQLNFLTVHCLRGQFGKGCSKADSPGVKSAMAFVKNRRCVCHAVPLPANSVGFDTLRLCRRNAHATNPGESDSMQSRSHVPTCAQAARTRSEAWQRWRMQQGVVFSMNCRQAALAEESAPSEPAVNVTPTVFGHTDALLSALCIALIGTATLSIRWYFENISKQA